MAKKAPDANKMTSGMDRKINRLGFAVDVVIVKKL
jgi:hypothetical protein